MEYQDAKTLLQGLNEWELKLFTQALRLEYGRRKQIELIEPTKKMWFKMADEFKHDIGVDIINGKTHRDSKFRRCLIYLMKTELIPGVSYKTIAIASNQKIGAMGCISRNVRTYLKPWNDRRTEYKEALDYVRAVFQDIWEEEEND